MGKWQRNSLSMAGRVIVVNHIIGGMMNFYLGVWSLSKAAIARVNRLLGDFIWGKSGGKGIRVGWSWCALPRDLGGLGVPNISAKGKALAAKWTLKALDSLEPWAEWYKAHIQKAEFKDFKGWAGVAIENKVLGDWEIDMKGTNWIKRMWVAWVSVRPSLDLKGSWNEGGMFFKKGCLWLDPRESSQRSWIHEERLLVRKIRRKGLWEWGQLLGENGMRVKEWAELKKEFSLGRVMKPLVEERIEKFKRACGTGIREDGNWWRRVRWKDGAPSLSPRTKFLYRELVEGERCQQKIARGWNFEGQSSGLEEGL